MNGLTWPAPAWANAIGLLIVRLVVGGAFILHGWPKIQNATGWMGDAVPGFLQATAAVIEVGGGALLALGLFARIAPTARPPWAATSP
jgi:putative oxidoreductase